jgi:hypothetical protein
MSPNCAEVITATLAAAHAHPDDPATLKRHGFDPRRGRRLLYRRPGLYAVGTLDTYADLRTIGQRDGLLRAPCRLVPASTPNMKVTMARSAPERARLVATPVQTIGLRAGPCAPKRVRRDGQRAVCDRAGLGGMPPSEAPG